MRMAGDAQNILTQMQIENENRLYCMKQENRHKAECARFLYEGLGSAGGDKPKPEQPKPEPPTENTKPPANPKAVK